MRTYRTFVKLFERLFAEGKSIGPASALPQDKVVIQANAPAVLIFSPHPDDECIIGGFALRLLREVGMRVINIAVTQGAHKERQQPRWVELRNACRQIGFELEQTAPGGLENVNKAARTTDPKRWAWAVNVIAALLLSHQPRIIFFPHELDWNSTHIGTHFLVMDALASLPADFQTLLAETEFWGQMPSPNLMVESSADDVADLIAALSFHLDEMRRNPYHLRLPAWLMDNVRRGAELVGGQGGAAPDFLFATLYRVRRWENGRVEEKFSGGKQIAVQDFPGNVFRWTTEKENSAMRSRA